MMTQPKKSQQTELIERLSNRWWRLNNLYKIQDEKGVEVVFKPNPVQVEILRNLWWLNLILKSRQHGVTTLACIYALDKAMWEPGSRCGVIAHTKDDAGKFFRLKILYAYDHLPDELKAMVPLKRRDLGGTLEFENGSLIDVSVSHRGGTFQFLHISEYGPMCAMFPQRAEEVKAGALNTVHEGSIVTIESTAKGREGDFYDRCQRSINLKSLHAGTSGALTRMDYKFFFFSWFDDPRNRMDPAGVSISDESAKYFAELEAKTDVKLTADQKAWYVKKAEDQGSTMLQEHPSTPEEAFQAASEAAYFTNELAMARKTGRVTNIPFTPSVPVNTFWDLGRNDLNAIWFHQHVGLTHRFIGYYENSLKPIHHYAQYLREFKDKHGIVYGTHYLPHDAEVTELTRQDGKSRKEVLEDLGVAPIIVVERIDDLREGIDALRRAFPSMWFDVDACKIGIDRLANYQREYNERTGSFTDYPRKNDARNGTDALRQFAQGYETPATKNRDRAKKRSWRTS